MIKYFYLTDKGGPNKYNHSGQSGSGSNGYEMVLHISQISQTIRLISFQGLLFLVGGPYHSVEM